MRFLKFIRRLYWKAVLCEPEERAEILSLEKKAHAVYDFESQHAYRDRKARYEEAFGPFKP